MSEDSSEENTSNINVKNNKKGFLRGIIVGWRSNVQSHHQSQETPALKDTDLLETKEEPKDEVIPESKQDTPVSLITPDAKNSNLVRLDVESESDDDDLEIRMGVTSTTPSPADLLSVAAPDVSSSSPASLGGSQLNVDKTDVTPGTPGTSSIEAEQVEGNKRNKRGFLRGVLDGWRSSVQSQECPTHSTSCGQLTSSSSRDTDSLGGEPVVVTDERLSDSDEKMRTSPSPLLCAPSLEVTSSSPSLSTPMDPHEARILAVRQRYQATTSSSDPATVTKSVDPNDPVQRLVALNRGEQPKQGFLQGIFSGTESTSEQPQPRKPRPPRDRAQAQTGGLAEELRKTRQGLDDRGEELDRLEDRTERMATEAEGFRDLSHQLLVKYKNKKWYQF